jgi:hypothetical protein
MRNVGVRAVPINWPAKLPTDAWSSLSAKATHVVFITGLFDKSTEVDALAAAADPKVAAQRVLADGKRSNGKRSKKTNGGS